MEPDHVYSGDLLIITKRKSKNKFTENLINPRMIGNLCEITVAKNHKKP